MSWLLGREESSQNLVASIIRDEQQTAGNSSAKSYCVTYTTQDLGGGRQSRKQGLSASSEPVSNTSFSILSEEKESETEGSLHRGHEEELEIKRLSSGTNRTHGEVISSRCPNVSLHLSEKEIASVPNSKTIEGFDCREEDTKSSQLVHSQQEIGLIEDDWVILNPVPNIRASCKAEESLSLLATERLHQMALSEIEHNLIKASWVPIREDPVTAGLLLFDGLFTKYPKYLSYFSQFSINMDSMKENKRLITHAVKVIEKVTYVVDALGNEAMTGQLNEALIKLVRSHLEKKIGLEEFTNLGEVLIDFICFVNYHGLARAYASSLLKERSVMAQVIDNSDAANNNNTDTMTSTLDKIRASSTHSSSSDDDSYLAAIKQKGGGAGSDGIHSDETITSCAEQSSTDCIDGDHNQGVRNFVLEDHLSGCQNKRETKLDFNVLVPAWRTLYKGVKDLVRQEEEASKIW